MRRFKLAAILAVLLQGLLSGAEPKDFVGAWELVPQKSSVIPLYRTLSARYPRGERFTRPGPEMGHPGP